MGDTEGSLDHLIAECKTVAKKSLHNAHSRKRALHGGLCQKGMNN